MLGSLIQSVLRAITSSASALGAASRGMFSGKASTDGVAAVLRATEGLDTAAIRAASEVTSGARSAAGGLPNLAPGVYEMLKEVSYSLMATGLVTLVEFLVEEIGGAERMEKETGKAADAVDTVHEESDRACEEVVRQLEDAISHICAFLGSCDPEKHPDAFASAVDAGAQLIDQATCTIESLCTARNEAIGSCLSTLIDAGGALCQSPQGPSPEACLTGPASAGAAVSAEGASPVSAGAAAESSAQGESSAAPAVTPASKSASSESLATDAQAGSCGVAGLVGVGVATLALGWLVGAVGECLAEAATECQDPAQPAGEPTPEPVPEPAPQPKPAAVPAPEPVPEPVPAGVEPPPKPIPVSVSEPPPKPITAAETPTPSVTVRKAGGW